MRQFLLSSTVLSTVTAIALFPFDAIADPIIVAAVISAGAGTAVAYAAGTIAAGAVLGYFATSFMISAGLSFAMQSLSPKPKGSGISSAANSAILTSGVSPVADHQIIYGQTKVGGVIVYKEATQNNKFLHVVVALAGHECEAIETVYLNDEALTLDEDGNVTAPEKYENLVRINTHLGSATQLADSDLVADSAGKWTANHRLQGICYVYARLEFNGDAFPNGEPNITAIVKGKKVYNPNTSSTAWSANSALCVRDYLFSNYGLNSDASEIDDALVIVAANICDEDITLSEGGTEDRYTTNGAISTGTKPAETIDALLRCMGGSLWYAQGKWRIKAAAYITPIFSFTEDDLRSNVSIQTRHSRRDNYNIVKGTFRGEASNWQFSDFPEIRSQTFIDADNGDESGMDLEMGLVSSAATAQRIAKIALYQNREQLTLSASFGLRAFQVQVGDVINFTNTRAGFTDKPFEVVNWVFAPNDSGEIVVNMTLRETSSAVYDWDAEESAFELNNTILADPFDVPAIGLSVTSEARIINEHLTNVLKINTTSSSPERVDYVEVQFKKTTETEYTNTSIGDLGLFEILDVADDFYDVRVRGVNTLGIKGDFNTYSGFQVTGLADPPADVSDLSATVNNGAVFVEWEAVPDLDLSFYRIRYALETAGATWANATTASEKIARPATNATLPARSGTYMIRAYDKIGNASVNYSSFIVPVASIQTFATSDTQTEHSGFTGTKTGCSVSSGSLIITDPSTAPSTATYEFSNYIDTGSVRRVTSRIDLETVRVDNSAGLWDNISGNWDTWAGNWDNWTGAAQFADTDVLRYIATTDDNPASSPTWSDWKAFKAGDFSGRAFKFKIELKSTSNSITPSIDFLKAYVEYN